MASVFIEYDNNGRYVGHVYGSHGNLNTNNKVRELTIQEVRTIGTQFDEYRYDKPQIEKLLEVYFRICPKTIYEIGLFNKISVCICRSNDTTDDEYAGLVGRTFNIKINDGLVPLLFEEEIYLNPSQPGIYTFDLVDERLYAKQRRYVVSVIESQQETSQETANT